MNGRGWLASWDGPTRSKGNDLLNGPKIKRGSPMMWRKVVVGLKVGLSVVAPGRGGLQAGSHPTESSEAIGANVASGAKLVDALGAHE